MAMTKKQQAEMNRLMRERDHYKSLAKDPTAQKPLFFTKLFNEMPEVTKAQCVDACSREISEAFIGMDTNLKETDPLQWAGVVDRLRNALEAHVKRTSNYPWTISKRGSICGSLDFKLHSKDKSYKDYIDIVWTHLGYKAPRTQGAGLTTAERIAESPTPSPVAVKLHTRVYRRDF